MSRHDRRHADHRVPGAARGADRLRRHGRGSARRGRTRSRRPSIGVPLLGPGPRRGRLPGGDDGPARARRQRRHVLALRRRRCRQGHGGVGRAPRRPGDHRRQLDGRGGGGVGGRRAPGRRPRPRARRAVRSRHPAGARDEAHAPPRAAQAMGPGGVERLLREGLPGAAPGGPGGAPGSHPRELASPRALARVRRHDPHLARARRGEARRRARPDARRDGRARRRLPRPQRGGAADRRTHRRARS